MRSFLVLGLAIAGLVLIAAGAFLIAYGAILKAHADRAAANNVPITDGSILTVTGSGLSMVGTVGDQISKLKPGDRLIAWGLVLLLLAGMVSGYLDISLGEVAGATE